MEIDNLPAMTKKLAQGALASGGILFIWSAICWMALPFHNNSFRAFSGQGALSLALRLAAPESGVYLMPHPGEKMQMTEEHKSEPFVLAAVNRDAFGSMGGKMAGSFVIQSLGGLLVMWLLLQTAGLSYWAKVRFAAGVGAAVWVLGHLPYWNWWGFTCGYTAAYLIDLVAGWFLAGLALAKIAEA